MQFFMVNPLMIQSDALGGLRPAAVVPRSGLRLITVTKSVVFLDNIEVSQAPPPQRVQGWRRGGQSS